MAAAARVRVSSSTFAFGEGEGISKGAALVAWLALTYRRLLEKQRRALLSQMLSELARECSELRRLRIKTQALAWRHEFWMRTAYFHAWVHVVFVVHGGTHGFVAKYASSPGPLAKPKGAALPGTADWHLRQASFTLNSKP